MIKRSEWKNKNRKLWRKSKINKYWLISKMWHLQTSWGESFWVCDSSSSRFYIHLWKRGEIFHKHFVFIWKQQRWINRCVLCSECVIMVKCCTAASCGQSEYHKNKLKLISLFKLFFVLSLSQETKKKISWNIFFPEYFHTFSQLKKSNEGAWTDHPAELCFLHIFTRVRNAEDSTKNHQKQKNCPHLSLRASVHFPISFSILSINLLI